nr:MAG TPA: Dihydrofolate reductase [Bacteriophage sp.]
MINMIVCMDKGDGIGVNGGLLYHLKGDLKHFRQKTLGTTIIMGRKTFESLPNVLPHREHWVITQDKDYKVPKGVKVFHSREDVLNELGDRRAFVIGGSSIYDMFIEDVTSIYVTKVDKKKKADTYFKFSRDDFSWSQIGMQQNDIDELSGERLNYTFEVYTRKNLLKVVKGEDSTLQNLT